MWAQYVTWVLVEKDICCCVGKPVLGSRDQFAIRTDYPWSAFLSFVEFRQISVKAATTLKAKAMIADPIDPVLLNFRNDYPRYLIGFSIILSAYYLHQQLYIDSRGVGMLPVKLGLSFHLKILCSCQMNCPKIWTEMKKKFKTAFLHGSM